MIMNSNEEQISSKENQDTNIKCDYTETLCLLFISLSGDFFGSEMISFKTF